MQSGDTCQADSGVCATCGHAASKHSVEDARHGVKALCIACGEYFAPPGSQWAHSYAPPLVCPEHGERDGV